MDTTTATTHGARLTERFALCAGSIVGREHVRLHRNNQDGVALRADDGRLVAAVTDGCSSGRSCEVGARLCAAWLAAWTPELIGDATPGGARFEVALHEVGLGLAGYLSRIAQGLCPELRVRPAVVADFLLFSFIVALIRPRDTVVFGVGDGVVSVNGRTRVLDPGPDNAPAYIAYRLVGADRARSSAPELLFSGPTDEVTSLLIATDGAAELITRADEPLVDARPLGGIAPFETDPRYARNPSLLQKRLVVIGERHRRLSDDTTIALLRRRPAPGER